MYDGGFYAQSMQSFDRAAETRDDEERFVAFAWQGHVLDVTGTRTAAMEKYRAALALSAAPEVTHAQYGMTLNRRWVERRLETPFVRSDPK